MTSIRVQEKRAFRRQQILEHAADAFNTFGYEGLSIARLAKSMGMRNSNIYYYFDSKEELLKECYCSALTEYADSLDRIRQNASSYEDTIGQFFEFHFLTWHAIHKKERPALAMIYEQHLLSPTALEAVREVFSRVQQSLEIYFKQGQANGLLRIFSYQAAADILHAIFEWGTVWVAALRNEDEVLKAARLSADVYLNGIATHYEPKLLSELRHLETSEQIIQRAAGHVGQFPAKDAISNVATRLFNSIGFEASSVDMICKEVGLTKGAFYHHFKNKNAVLMYSFQQAIAFDKYLYQTVTQDAKDGLDAIKLLIQLDSTAIRNQHIQLPLFRLTSKLAEDDVSQTIQEVDYIRTRFMELVASGVHDKSLHCQNSSVIAHCCFAMKQRILRFPNRMNGSSQSLLDDAWDIFYHGTLKRND